MPRLTCVAFAMSSGSSLSLSRCRRTIFPPAQLEHEPSKFMNRVWVDHAGVNLLTDRTADVHESALKLVKRGAVSGELCTPKLRQTGSSHACMHFAHWTLIPCVTGLQIPCQSTKCTSRALMEHSRQSEVQASWRATTRICTKSFQGRGTRLIWVAVLSCS